MQASDLAKEPQYAHPHLILAVRGPKEAPSQAQVGAHEGFEVPQKGADSIKQYQVKFKNDQASCQLQA